MLRTHLTSGAFAFVIPTIRSSLFCSWTERLRDKPSMLHSACSFQVSCRPRLTRTFLNVRLRQVTCMSNNRCATLAGVKELPSRYQGVLLDQFGVLHDGQNPYAGAQEAVKWLSDQGLKILILSNSSKRSSDALQRIQTLGFQREWFAGAITSGEVTFVQLRDRVLPELKALGTKCLHFTWGSRGNVSLDGLNLQVMQHPTEADFILCHGTEALAQQDAESSDMSLSDMKKMLKACSERTKAMPMIVANPDVVTVSGDLLIPMPGTLGEYYASLGGQVHWMGKPDPIIYSVALDMLQLPTESIVAIGDSLQHDVQGAHSAGVDSVFITGGIHAKDVAGADGKVDSQKMAHLLTQHSGSPTYTMPCLAV